MHLLLECSKTNVEFIFQQVVFLIGPFPASFRFNKVYSKSNLLYAGLEPQICGAVSNRSSN